MKALLVLLPLLAAPASAEVVFLRHGQTIGNGWLFVDRDGSCRVATPAHVVQAAPDGPPVDGVLLTTRAGRTFEAGAVMVPDANLDLAFLEVAPYGPGNLCTRSRLGSAGLGHRIDALRDGELRIMEEGGELREPVDLVSTSRADLASTLTVRLRDPAFELVEGHSGAMILLGDEPAGMVIMVAPEDRLAIALRADAIAAKTAAPRTQAFAGADAPASVGAGNEVQTDAAATGEVGIIGVQGVTGASPDATHPPSSSATREGWVVTPVAGRIAFDVLTGGNALTHLSFDVEGLDAGKAIIEHRAGESGLTYVGPCPVAMGRAECSLGHMVQGTLRVTLPAQAPVRIFNLRLKQ